VDPNSIVGDRLVWKNDTKNKISDTMNRIIPHRRPFVTILYVILDMSLLGLRLIITELLLVQ
jgi:hypothetical protein